MTTSEFASHIINTNAKKGAVRYWSYTTTTIYNEKGDGVVIANERKNGRSEVFVCGVCDYTNNYSKMKAADKIKAVEYFNSLETEIGKYGFLYLK